MRARGQRGLDVRGDGETLLDGVLGEKTGSEHDVGVRRVGARGDGGNDEVTLLEGVVFAFVGELGSLGGLVTLEAETLEADLVGHAGFEIRHHVSEVDTIVRSLGTGKRALNSAQIEGHNFTRVVGVSLGAVVLHEEVLFAQVLLDQLNVAFVTTSSAKVIHGAVIDGEVSHGCAVLRSHVSNGSSVSEAEILDTRSEEFDELADDTTLTKHLDTGQDQVSSGGGLRKITVEVEADNLGQDHRDGLTKHDSLSLDTANTPAGDTKTIDHGRVGVSADDGVRVEHVLTVEHNAGKVLKVDLMDDTRAGRHDLEVVEGLGAPLEELESLAITLELEALVVFTGVGSAGGIDLDGVIDDEVNGA